MKLDTTEQIHRKSTSITGTTWNRYQHIKSNRDLAMVARPHTDNDLAECKEAVCWNLRMKLFIKD